MYQFPKDLYADIRIEESYGLGVGMRNGELDGDRVLGETGARIRVFDGKMWYTSVTNNIEEIQQWHVIVACNHTKTYFYSSKGAKIVQDKQNCWLDVGYSITVDGITTGGSKAFCKVSMDELWGHEKEILSDGARYLDYVYNDKQMLFRVRKSEV